MNQILLDTSYTVQAGDTLESIAEKGFGNRDRWPEIREEDGTHFTTIDSSHLEVGQTVYLPVKIGERFHPAAGYGKGDDFLSDDELNSLSPLSVKFYESLIQYSPANLILNRKIIQPLIEHFLRGNGEVYQHNIQASLSALIADAPPFKEAFEQVKYQVHEQLKSQENLDQIDIYNLQISIPHFAFRPGKADLTLFAAISGIQGAELLLKQFKIDSDNRYSLDVFFVIYDDFGFGKTDRYSPSLYAAWNLQHRGKAKPFVNEMILHKTIVGTLSS
ncbi:MAG: LysM peptidoglycan-binding domain-containing protein [Cyanobacteria bacterium J06592_8]